MEESRQCTGRNWHAPSLRNSTRARGQNQKPGTLGRFDFCPENKKSRERHKRPRPMNRGCPWTIQRRRNPMTGGNPMARRRSTRARGGREPTGNVRSVSPLARRGARARATAGNRTGASWRLAAGCTRWHVQPIRKVYNLWRRLNARACHNTNFGF